MKLKLVKEIEGHKDGILSSEIRNDILITGSEDNNISVWKLPHLNKIKDLTGHKSDVKKVIFSPKGDRIVSCSTDKTIKIWDSANYLCLNTLEEHSSEVNSISFLNDNNFISSSDDKTIKLWDINKKSSLKTINLKSGDINAIDSSGEYILAGGSNLIFMDLKFSILKKCEDYLYGINFIKIKNDTALISTSMEKNLEVWDLKKFELIRKLKNSSWINFISLYQDKIILAMGEYIKVLNSNLETELEFEAHKDEIYSISVYGNYLITAGNDKILKLWEIIN